MIPYPSAAVRSLLASLRFVALAGLLIAGTVCAQPAPNYAPDGPGYPGEAPAAADPPTRVARLALVQGAVSFAPAGEDSWIQAEINRPLISGDRLWTDRGGRAELQIGSSTVRVDEQSNFSFLDLDDNMAQIELTGGTLNLRVRRIYDGQTYEVDTPTLAFVINRVGEYRIDVAPDGNGTIVTAFHGGGDAYGEAGARFRIEEGQSVRFNDPQLRDYVSNPVPSPDDFDRFCFERDARWDNSPSRQYVSEDVIGYADLDNYGTWDSAPDYGNVWYPTNVAAGWTPYSYGNWAWVGAYGWTWIDASPWGFAPFHYGRWAWINNRWGWCPGPARVRPYWAPALVAFVGGGARLSFGAGPIGWFPLGPRDVYVPGYRVSQGYFTNINLYNARINTVTINNFYGNYRRGDVDFSRINYANRNVANAITAVRGDAFLGSREIRGSAIAVNRDTFANARVASFAAIAPTRASLGGARVVTAPPRAVQTRNIIAATRPPAPVASFAQREAQLQRDPGRALSVTQMRAAAPAVAGNGAQAHGAAVAARPNVNVVTRAGAPARTVGAGPLQMDNRAIEAARAANPQTPRVQPNAPVQNRGVAAPQVERAQTNAPVQNRAVTAPQIERAQTNESRALPSSRYVHPEATGNAQPAPRAPGEDSGIRQYRSAPVEHTPQTEVRQQPRPQQVEAPQRREAQPAREFQPRQQPQREPAFQPQQRIEQAQPREAPRVQPMPAQREQPQQRVEQAKPRVEEAPRAQHEEKK